MMVKKSKKNKYITNTYISITKMHFNLFFKFTQKYDILYILLSVRIIMSKLKQ